jgi:NADP-dependent 3-hydroxy acid dehydrogenase YdfG
MASSRELSGRVAVITGGTSGIGRATAELMVAAGARVIIAARTQSAVQQTADVLGCEGVAVDAGEESGVEQLRAAAPDADIIVHAAGAFELAPLHETDVATFDRMLAVNLRAAFLLTRAFLPALLTRGAGDIVLIGSVAGRAAFPANGAYSASKFGLRGMHAVLHAELRGTGVRASLIEPAATDTPLWDAVDRERNSGLPPREAMLSPRSVAEAVLFAASQPRGTVTPNILLERA